MARRIACENWGLQCRENATRGYILPLPAVLSKKAVANQGLVGMFLWYGVAGNGLMISGQRPDVSRSTKCKFLVMEINYGPFECVIEIPPGYDLGEAKAAYQNGFLRIDVPQASRSPAKAILVPISEEK